MTRIVETILVETQKGTYGAGDAAEAWGNAKIVKAVSVTEMHAWIKQNPNAFVAAIRWSTYIIM